MTWLCPELNPAFRDFNFSSLIDPALPVLVPAARVSELLERGQDHEVADIIMTTLRNGSFEAYQRTHGPRPLDYADWCVYKTAQFLDLLSCGYQPDELLKESPDARLPNLPWLDIVRGTRVPEGASLSAWLSTTSEGPQDEPPRRGWSRNRRRNEIIQACQQRGVDGAQICDALDRQAVNVLESLTKHGVTRWTDGWNDPDIRPHIQQLLSKRKRVKS